MRNTCHPQPVQMAAGHQEKLAERHPAGDERIKLPLRSLQSLCARTLDLQLVCEVTLHVTSCCAEAALMQAQANASQSVSEFGIKKKASAAVRNLFAYPLLFVAASQLQYKQASAQPHIL